MNNGRITKSLRAEIAALRAENTELRLELIAAHGQAGDALDRAVQAEAALQRARDDALEEAAKAMSEWADCHDKRVYPLHAQVTRAGAKSIRAMKGKQ